MSRSPRHRWRRAHRSSATTRTDAGTRSGSQGTRLSPECGRDRRSPPRRAPPCGYRHRRERCAQRQPARSWSCHSFPHQGPRDGTHRRAGGQDSDRALAQAPLRSRSPNRCVRCAGPRSPGRLITSKAPNRGRPICGSDRVSEALHVPYQRDNRARGSSLPICAPHLLLETDVQCERYGAFQRRSRTPLWSAVAAGTTGSLPAALRDSRAGALVARGTARATATARGRRCAGDLGPCG